MPKYKFDGIEINIDDERTLITSIDFVDIIVKLIPYLYIEMTSDEHKQLIDELINRYIEYYDTFPKLPNNIHQHHLKQLESDLTCLLNP